MEREYLMRYLWCRVMLDSGAPSAGFTPERGVAFVAHMLGASPIEVGLSVGGDFLTGVRPLPSREILAKDAARLSALRDLETAPSSPFPMVEQIAQQQQAKAGEARAQTPVPSLEDLRRLRNEIRATRSQIKSDPVNGGRADDCPNILARKAFFYAARAYVVSLLEPQPAELSTLDLCHRSLSSIVTEMHAHVATEAGEECWNRLNNADYAMDLALQVGGEPEIAKREAAEDQRLEAREKLATLQASIRESAQRLEALAVEQFAFSSEADDCNSPKLADECRREGRTYRRCSEELLKLVEPSLPPPAMVRQPVQQQQGRAGRADGWQDIETAPKDRTRVIVAVPSLHAGEPMIVGEAYFDPESYDGTWWWAGTNEGDYYASPIHETNAFPALWQPLPAPPESPTPSASLTKGGV